VRLATGPVTWGVDFADAPDNPPWTEVLNDIERSGIGALELGPVGYLPEEPGALRAALDGRGLTAVGSFVFEDFHDPASSASNAATTLRACRAIAAAGGSVLVLIDRPAAERAATAGRSAHAARLSGNAWRTLVDGLENAAAIATEHGLRPAVHPHAGSYIEFEDEVERLLDDTKLDLCFDTGHAAYAGVAPAEALRTYGARVAHVHLKDVSGAVLGRIQAEPLGFWEAVAAGVFCPLGEGVVDLPAVLDALAEAEYSGYATIEQDRVPGSGAPLDDLARSVAALHAGNRS
jgi:inosose dehydratase